MTCAYDGNTMVNDGSVHRCPGCGATRTGFTPQGIERDKLATWTLNSLLHGDGLWRLRSEHGLHGLYRLISGQWHSWIEGGWEPVGRVRTWMDVDDYLATVKASRPDYFVRVGTVL